MPRVGRPCQPGLWSRPDRALRTSQLQPLHHHPYKVSVPPGDGLDSPRGQGSSLPIASTVRGRSPKVLLCSHTLRSHAALGNTSATTPAYVEGTFLSCE